MTEPIEPSAPSDDAAAADADGEQIDLEAARKLRSENRNLRSRLKAAEEGQEANLAFRAMHERNVIEAAARNAGFIDPDDFIALHPDGSDLVDELDQVVEDKVAAAARAILEQKPYLGRSTRPPSDRPIESLRSTYEQDRKPTPTWAQALRGK